MPSPKFLQIHTLTSYTGVLLNRDDQGLAKRLMYGDVIRTRISSQAIKRHWRDADDPHAIDRIADVPASYRSREAIVKKIADPLRGSVAENILEVLVLGLHRAVYGEKAESRESRQVLLLGEPELDWLRNQAVQLAGEADGDPDAAGDAVAAWSKQYRANLAAMRANTTMPGGIVAALFGRMVTSDPAANIEAPIHVAHAFTVHAEESEGDYFTALDDLDANNITATIQDTELTSGIFYGYSVVDIERLVSNVGDASLAGIVLSHLVYLSAEVSPGSKRGSTAPYSRAELVLLEAGDRQPRNLAGAFREPVPPKLTAATTALASHLEAFDHAYDTREQRRALSLSPVEIPRAEAGSLADLAAWAARLTDSH